jgi:hypothetical protein
VGKPALLTKIIIVLFLFNSSNAGKTIITYPRESSPCNVLSTMHCATPHIIFQAVSHMLVNFVRQLMSPDATVVPVYVTIRVEDCHTREHQSP